MPSDKTQPHESLSEDTLHSAARGSGQRRKPRPSRGSLLLIGGLIAFGFLVAVALLSPVAAYGYYQLHGLIVPGVHVEGLNLGSMAWQEAYEGLAQVYGTDPEVLVSDGNRVWKAKASDFGVAWDIPSTIYVALSVGHGKALWAEAQEMIESLRGGWKIEMQYAFDETVARESLDEWKRTVEIPAVDANLQIKDGLVVVTDSHMGHALDIEATLEGLLENPKGLLEGRQLLLRLVPIEPEIRDVAALAAEAERLLSAKLRIDGYDPIEYEHVIWDVTRSQIAEWLVVERGAAELEVRLAMSQMDAFMQQLNEGLQPDRFLNAEEGIVEILGSLRDGSIINLRLYHSRTTYIVQRDDTLLKIGWKLGFPYWMIVDANPHLYYKALEAGEELLIPSRDKLLPLPVIPNKRIIISIPKQRLWTYADGQLLMEYVVSTGVAKSPTQPGVFQVRSHELNAYASIWDLYMPHFLGIYEAGPGFMNGIHGLPMLSSGRRLWANVLGRPASYGCIILNLADAEELYHWAEDGVVVEIQR